MGLSEGSIPLCSVTSLDVAANFLFKLMQRSWGCSGFPLAWAWSHERQVQRDRSQLSSQKQGLQLSIHTPTSRDGPWRWQLEVSLCQEPAACRATSSRVIFFLAVQCLGYEGLKTKPNIRLMRAHVITASFLPHPPIRFQFSCAQPPAGPILAPAVRWCLHPTQRKRGQCPPAGSVKERGHFLSLVPWQVWVPPQNHCGQGAGNTGHLFGAQMWHQGRGPVLLKPT